LHEKLKAYVDVQKAFAAEIGKQRWVPDVQFGAEGGSNGGSATDLINMLNAKTAQDLSLNMKMRNK